MGSSDWCFQTTTTQPYLDPPERIWGVGWLEQVKNKFVGNARRVGFSGQGAQPGAFSPVLNESSRMGLSMLFAKHFRNPGPSEAISTAVLWDACLLYFR
jgi:hypothetical protein